MSEAEKNRRLDYRKIRKKWIALQASILVITILITLVASVVYFQLNKTHYVNYHEASAVDYGVTLKENEFFTEKYLGKDQAYVASLIDQVSAAFEYELLMEKAQQIDFQYSYRVDAILEIQDNKSGVIYKPTYELVPTRSNARTGSGLIIREVVMLDYDQYNELAHKFIKELGLENTTCNIRLQMQVNVIGKDESFSNLSEQNNHTIELQITLTTQTVNFNMTATIPQGEKQIMVYNNQVAIVVFQVIAIVFLCVSILLGVEILAFIYLTRNTDITYEIKVSRLLKSYKSFIQKINNPFNMAGYQLLMVDTFNEMLEIRDTIQSPILMNENTDKTCTRFFIPTNTKLLYVYELKVDDYDEIYGTDMPDEESVIEEPAVPTAQTVDKPVVVTVERPVVQFVEKPIEIALNTEEPAQEDTVAQEDSVQEDLIQACMAAAAASAPVESSVTLNVVETAEDEENSTNAYSAVRRSFMAKLIQSTDDRKRYFSEIKNELLSYRGVKARTSWNLESFNKGRTHLAKIAIRGKTVCLYLALEPSEFIDSKYFYTDVSDKTQFRTVPMMIKVKSNRGVKHAKELIEAMAVKYELVKKPDYTPEDYVLPYQTTEELIEQGLIKDPNLELGEKETPVVEPKETYKDLLDQLFEGMINDVTARLTSEMPKQAAEAPAVTTMKVVEAPSVTVKKPIKKIPDDVVLLESVSAAAVIDALSEPDVSIDEIDYVDVQVPEVEDGVEIVDVVWKEKEEQNTLHQYDPNGAELSRGDIVLVPTEDGQKKGEVIRKAAVAHGNYKVDPVNVDSPLKKIIGVLKRKMQDAINSNLD